MRQVRPPAPTDEPGWAKGRPKSEMAMKMAPVPAFPIPTSADKLPTHKFKLPPGFKVETWASGVLDARGLRQGAKGNVFVSSLFVANKVYVPPERGKREPKVIIDKMPLATGIEFHRGSLYLATNTKIMRYDNIEDKLDNPGEPQVLYDKLPGGTDHSWKYLRIHKDKLYFAIGGPCNICDPGEYARIYRMNLDGSNIETVASGVRNTVGFDFDPKTGDLWFTDNGRDWFSEELPNDELNHVTKPGQQHFGFPYCHQGNIPDPEFGCRPRLEKPALRRAVPLAPALRPAATHSALRGCAPPVMEPMGEATCRSRRCIAGQREDYLQMSLRGFRSGTRPGYTQAMSAAVSQIPVEDLDTLAYYVARFPGPAKP